ncbi:MAG: hypothetical protein D6759_09380 [Chloroflexi bacterium]|nr:MAG: hypothetical protein D6759_09380 [Chloroflexota bacterium]
MATSSTTFLRAINDEVLETHRAIQALWSSLTRQDRPEELDRLPLPHPYVVPSTGLFPYQFYWDSFFTILGLMVDGEEALAAGMVENFLYEMETFGRVLNYNHPAIRTRSQPPYLTAMIAEVLAHRLPLDDEGRAWLRRAYALAAREYEEIWMGEHATPIGLCRYADAADPEDEERAQYESGWDFSSRWGGRCRRIAPVDLNSNLYGYARDLARFARLLGDEEGAMTWERRAAEVRTRVQEYCWDEEAGFFFDYDLDEARRLTERPSLAGFQPLWAGLASPEQADAVVEWLLEFEQRGGLSCTLRTYPIPGVEAPQGEAGKRAFWLYGPFQWDYPNGWPPLQWLVVAGLRRYGYFEDAGRLAREWLTMVAHLYRETGKLWEKYDVVRRSHQAIGHYPVQAGFGWTNGVFEALLGRAIGGLGYDLEAGCPVLEPLTSEALFDVPFEARYRGYLGLDLSLYWAVSPDLRDLEVRLEAHKPLPRLLVRIRDHYPSDEVTVTVDGEPVEFRRGPTPTGYAAVTFALEDVGRAEIRFASR